MIQKYFSYEEVDTFGNAQHFVLLLGSVANRKRNGCWEVSMEALNSMEKLKDILHDYMTKTFQLLSNSNNNNNFSSLYVYTVSNSMS